MKKQALAAAVRAREPLPNSLPIYAPRAEILREFIQSGKRIAPFEAELKRSAKNWSFVPPESLLSPASFRRVRRQLFKERHRLQAQFSLLAGRAVTKAESEAIMHAASDEWEARITESLTSRHESLNLVRHNLEVDGSYLLAGDKFAYTPASGNRLVFDIRNDIERTTAISVMVCMFVLETVGLLFSLVGLALPTPPASGVADDVARLIEDSRFRRILKRVLDAVTDSKLSYAEKLEAILELAKSIFEAGLLGVIVKKAFDDLPWWRVAILVAMFLAQILLILNPATAGALAAKKALTIGQGVASLAGKAWELADILEKKA